MTDSFERSDNHNENHKQESVNVPELRFPEFTDEWQTVTLDDVTSKSGYGVGAAATIFDGENKYLRITDIDDSSHKFVPSPLMSPEGDIDNKFILEKNDIVFARTGASVGKTYLYNQNDGKLIYAGFLVKFNISKADPYFVFLNTMRPAYDNWVRIMSMRSGQPGINLKEYKKLSFNMPKIEEQQKISSFLALIDKKIEFMEKKYHKMINYKRFLLINMFSLKNKNLPKIRFEEFNEKWQRVSLNDLVYFLDEKRIPINQRKREKLDNIYPYYGAAGIIDYVDEYIFDDTLLLLGEDGTIIPNLVSGKFWVSNHAHVLKNKENVNIDFLYYILSKINYNKYNTGTIQPKLNKETAKKIKIFIPKLKEQNKIVNFIEKIDYIINNIKKEIEVNKEFKRSLLSKMFC